MTEIKQADKKLLYNTLRVLQFLFIGYLVFSYNQIGERAYVLQIASLACILIIGIVGVFFRQKMKDWAVHPFVAAVAIVIHIQLVLDFQNFLQGKIETVEGVPSVFEESGSYKGGSWWYVEINQIAFSFPRTIPEEFKDRNLVVEYLPYSRFILEIRSE